MASDKPKSKAKKISGIILSVLTYVFFAICLVALIFSITAKRDADGAINIFGKQMRVVVSDSMSKCEQTDVSSFAIKDIPIKSMIFIELVPEEAEKEQEWYAGLNKGDVLTFRYLYREQETITHRITNITAKPTGGYIIELKGDNKATENVDTLEQIIDTTDNGPNYVIGKVTGQSYALGLLATAVKSPVGIICIIIVPCVVIAFFEIIRLVNVFTENKRKREKEESDKKDAELEEMRKQLELLQQAVGAQTTAEAYGKEAEEQSEQEKIEKEEK